MENIYEIPIWKKYTLSVEEAAVYFRIGENKLRSLINENKYSGLYCSGMVAETFDLKEKNLSDLLMNWKPSRENFSTT